MGWSVPGGDGDTAPAQDDFPSAGERGALEVLGFPSHPRAGRVCPDGDGQVANPSHPVPGQRFRPNLRRNQGPFSSQHMALTHKSQHVKALLTAFVSPKIHRLWANATKGCSCTSESRSAASACPGPASSPPCHSIASLGQRPPARRGTLPPPPLPHNLIYSCTSVCVSLCRRCPCPHGAAGEATGRDRSLRQRRHGANRIRWQRGVT